MVKNKLMKKLEFTKFYHQKHLRLKIAWRKFLSTNSHHKFPRIKSHPATFEVGGIQGKYYTAIINSLTSSRAINNCWKTESLNQ